MTLLHPWALLLLPLALTPFWLKSRQGQMYSWLEMVPHDRVSETADTTVRALVALLLAAIVLALAGPQGPDIKVQKVGKGAQTVVVIDRSVSMEHPFAGDSTSGRTAEVKATAARRLITDFINARPDDMIGVVAFTNAALHGVKITSNRKAVFAAINAATSAGINQTNIGAGITEGVSLFDDIPSSGSRAIILLSDGAGKISPRVKQKIHEQLTSKKLNLYWIVLREPDDISIFGQNPAYTPESMPAVLELDQYLKSLKIKYRAYEADNPTALQSALRDIDAREKNVIQYAVSMPGHDYARDLILLALGLCVLLFIVKNLRVNSWKTA
ncbi:MAG: vWA domain-containing protein [Methylocystis sp.]|uniref:vWA domain-containing protein n=1 Tax=Methylocystis sp. TaxID=1911079 RepID=UPI003DA5E87B